MPGSEFPQLSRIFAELFFASAFSPNHHTHPFNCALSATPSPHVAHITAVREGSGLQARRSRCRPPMAGFCRAPCSRVRAGMRSCFFALHPGCELTRPTLTLAILCR